MGLMVSECGSGPESTVAHGVEIRNGAGESVLRAKCKNDSGDRASSNDREVGLIVGGVGEVAAPLAIALAERGMNVAIIFWQQRASLAASIRRSVEQVGRRCLLIPGLGQKWETPHAFARTSIETILKEFGRLDVFISLTENPTPQERAKHSAQDASVLSSAVIPNMPLMTAALEEIVN